MNRSDYTEIPLSCPSPQDAIEQEHKTLTVNRNFS